MDTTTTTTTNLTRQSVVFDDGSLGFQVLRGGELYFVAKWQNDRLIRYYVYGCGGPADRGIGQLSGQAWELTDRPVRGLKRFGDWAEIASGLDDCGLVTIDDAREYARCELLADDSVVESVARRILAYV